MNERKCFKRKRCYYPIIAALSLFAVCSNLHASDKALQGVQEMGTEATATNLALATADDLVGTWIIDQVKVKKTVNDVSSENTYSPKQRFKSFTDCPNKITFTTDGKVIFEYNDKDPSEDAYTVKGNRITRMTPIAWLNYEYTITAANKIQLLYSVDYVRYSDDNKNSITEEYTFFGTKE